MENNYEIRYVPDVSFPEFVAGKGRGINANLINVFGLNRWLITEEDGTQYIVRPDSAKPHDA